MSFVKKLLMVLVAFCCVSALAAPLAAVSAVTFVDDFTMRINPDIRTTDPAFPSLVEVRRATTDNRDASQLTIRSGVNRGGVRYRINGLERIHLRVYSPVGTFAGVHGGTGELYFGVTHPPYHPSQVIDAYFFDGRIYADHWGWYALRGSRPHLVFESVSNPPPRNLLQNMGVNVYVAPTLAGPRTRVPLERAAIHSTTLGCGSLTVIEDFQSTVGRIPPTARYLWVEINDPGDNRLDQEGQRTSLAWVNLSGRALRMGLPPEEFFPPGGVVQTPEPPVPPTPPPPPSPPTPPAPPSAPAQPQARPAAPTAPARQPARPTTPPPEPPQPPEPPEPTREAPSTPATAQGVRATQPSLPRQQPLPPPEPPPPSVHHQTAAQADELIIYEISRQPQRTTSTWPVILYILVISSLIGYLLLRSRKTAKKRGR